MSGTSKFCKVKPGGRVTVETGGAMPSGKPGAQYSNRSGGEFSVASASASNSSPSMGKRGGKQWTQETA